MEGGSQFWQRMQHDVLCIDGIMDLEPAAEVSPYKMLPVNFVLHIYLCLIGIPALASFVCVFAETDKVLCNGIARPTSACQPHSAAAGGRSNDAPSRVIQ